jgi:signal peptidase I
VDIESGKTKDKHYTGFKKFRKDWLEPVIFAFLLAAVIRSFVIQPFKIPSGSMENTLLVGDQLMALKFTYGLKIPFTNTFILRFRNPTPGDVIIFKYPVDPSKDFIKRCIATEEQKVEIINKTVYVNGKVQPLPRNAKFIDLMPRNNYGPIVVPKNHMFVMGDNRDNSKDSRFWGFVPYDNIKGKAWIIWWSWNNKVPLYDLLHKVRWNRIFMLIH